MLGRDDIGIMYPFFHPITKSTIGDNLLPDVCVDVEK